MNRVNSTPPIQLGSDEVLADRDFTHPSQSQIDLQYLQQLRAYAQQLAKQADLLAPQKPTHGWNFADAVGLLRRMIVLQPQTLRQVSPIFVVGFCGQRRTAITAEHAQQIAELDGALVQELAQHPHMLAYCSIQTSVDGFDWANLVLLAHADGITHWRNSQTHKQAVDSLAPQYYRSIRLHNGILPHGIASANLVLHSTKYFDYTDTTPWRAVRQLQKDKE
jgi:hypothetical protein